MNKIYRILSGALVMAVATFTLGLNLVPSYAQTTPLSCSFNATANAGSPATVTAVGGTGSFTFSTTGGTITSAAGNTANVNFPTVGTFPVTVTSGNETATCNLTVNPVGSAIIPNVNSVVTGTPLSCSFPTTTNIGQPATATVTGGNGVFTWSAQNATVNNPVGNTFTISYPNQGVYTITVMSGGQTANCNLTVNPAGSQIVSTNGGTVTTTTTGALACAPLVQTTAIGQNASFVATGGNGTYTWSAQNANILNPTGAAFSVSYPSAGSRLVTVSSGGQTATCTASIFDPGVSTIPGFPNTGGGYGQE